VVTAVWTAQIAAQEVRRNHAFTFVAGTCEESQGDCQTRGPKAWTDDEASLVSAALDAIAARPLGRLVLNRVALQGVMTLRRFSSGGASRSKDPLVFNTLSIERARAGDRSVDVERVNRSLALKLRPTRVPSIRATRSPAEAFAEIGAHLVLDPKARTYLPADIVDYFDRHVFVPGVRPAAGL
jgi:hypothetical protein